MSKSFLSRGVCAAVAVVAFCALIPAPADATHSWASHWRRTAGVRNIPVRRFLSSIWISRYNTAMADWRKAAMTKIKPYTLTTGAQNPNCPMVAGQISACDGNYGATGWGGYAQIWWDGSGHALYGRALQNNYYFSGSSATTVAWRQHIICQEIGHLFGLGHVNEIQNNRNTGSCMDYTNDPDGGSGGASSSDPNNMHPNAHDYAIVNARHNHIGFIFPEAARDTPMPQAVRDYDKKRLGQFGRLVYSANDGLTERFEEHFPGGWGVATWVIKLPKGRESR